MKPRIKELRTAAGFKTRQALVDALGKDYTVRKLTSWETGERMLSLSQACDIADALGCTLDELAGRDFRAPERRDPARAEFDGIMTGLTPPERGRVLQAARDRAELESLRRETGEGGGCGAAAGA